ncbi:hypothetical protein XFUD_02435 [Xylella fastidiosa]|nr:DUF3108 domain-containing protein [Xylella fastidiosa]ALQ94198.1 hypothetical protein XFUD_02435 [Xylella fastidiosa]ALQ96395.1 DUF3108 domain-containing protein [Xylella fastidiosa]ETE34904.1 hypothetical protein B398_02275 [Xylella fastidiosa 32]
MKRFLSPVPLCLTALLIAIAPAITQSAPNITVPPVKDIPTSTATPLQELGSSPASPTPETLPSAEWKTPPLQPFVASYRVFYHGEEAGDAAMKVIHNKSNNVWQVNLIIRGRRGFASVLGLNIEQNTVFEIHNGVYVPLSQTTVKKALLFGKKVKGVYDWNARTAQWSGDLKKEQHHPIQLLPGDQSILLLNLSLIRDAMPNRTLGYRCIDVGKIRQYDYRTADTTEPLQVGDLSYDALRIHQINSGKNQTILWIANGVPTPIRILQRKNSEDETDLRLIDYQGT